MLEAEDLGLFLAAELLPLVWNDSRIANDSLIMGDPLLSLCHNERQEPFVLRQSKINRFAFSLGRKVSCCQDALAIQVDCEVQLALVFGTSMAEEPLETGRLKQVLLADRIQVEGDSLVGVQGQ